MANTSSNKPSIQKNVVYDSRNDISTGKKRAVDFTGGVSVAERARLFGAQVTHSSGAKNPPSQRPTANKQPSSTTTTKPTVIQPSYRANINRYPNPEPKYTSPERISRHYESPSPIQINERPNPEPSSTINSQNYSAATRPPYRHNHYYQPPQQRPFSTYDTFQSTIPKEQPPIRPNYTQVVPGESHTYDDDPYYQAYTRPQSLPLEPNYFQPIQDPLQALYGNPIPIYPQTQTQTQMPTIVNNDNNLDGVKAFDLGNLINTIQQDYLNNVRPYVSSVQFIEDDRSLANMGLVTPSRSRKDYSRRNNDIYLRQGATYHYDVIDMNGAYPRFLDSHHNDKHYSSIKRRQRRRHYHDRALSPIHIFESSNKLPTPPPPPSPPPAPVEKPPTPVAESSSEEEEDDTTAANTKTEEAKTSSESEDESSAAVEETPSKPVIEAPPPVANPIPPVTSRIPPKLVSSESSESEDSESESDSDSDEDDEEDKKPKPAPTARQSTNRTTPTTPSSNTRAVPLRTATNINNTTSQPPETSNSIHSFDLNDSEKPSGAPGKFRSIFNKILRKKS